MVRSAPGREGNSQSLRSAAAITIGPATLIQRTGFGNRRGRACGGLQLDFFALPEVAFRGEDHFIKLIFGDA
jgi:hypothetical protein